ncbi:DUF4270 domain-containing protein [Pedobacter sp. AW31-3R]|uniref:DUF4270 domain-containing protein n=1 Tax=Pedobacter sp. AW31-3R TaxID=3445781 RepID=UPI003FA17581
MKFTKLDLLTLLISLFLFSSCKDSSNIGLETDGSSATIGTLLDTVTVQSQTLADIPTTTAGLSRYPLGEMNDDVFGKTTASLAMAVGVPSSVDFRNSTNAVNATVDSAVLILPYATGHFYGDSTATYNISVSQLSSDIVQSPSFLSNKEYPSNEQLGTFSASIRPTTRPVISTIVTGAADTNITVAPQIRIKLNKDLIQSKIVALDSATLSTAARFNNAFKGLKVDASVASGKGGMIFLDFSLATVTDSTGAYIAIYYKQPNATTATQIDTLVSRFPITSATATPVAATIKHDYTGTEIENQLANPTVQYDKTYLQAMSGIRNKITFPYLKDLVSKVGAKMIVTKAELVVDTYNPADSIPFKISPVLTFYKNDIANQRIQVQDNNPYNATTNSTGDYRTYVFQQNGGFFGGGYDYTKKSYTLTLTNYVQDIIDGKVEDYGTYIAPISTTDTNPLNLYPYATSASRAVIGSFINSSRRIRLNIYYVKSQQ